MVNVIDPDLIKALIPKVKVIGPFEIVTVPLTESCEGLLTLRGPLNTAVGTGLLTFTVIVAVSLSAGLPLSVTVSSNV